jgi:hypothetical protein
MPQNNENLDLNENKWREQIGKTWGNYCSSCGALKDMANLKFIKKLGPSMQFLSECEACGLKTVISLMPNLGMQVTQIRTDVNQDEFEKFNSPITSNDYLEFYQGIKKLSKAQDLIKFLNK